MNRQTKEACQTMNKSMTCMGRKYKSMKSAFRQVDTPLASDFDELSESELPDPTLRPLSPELIKPEDESGRPVLRRFIGGAAAGPMGP